MRGQDEEFVDEEYVEDPSQCFVDWNSLLTYDTHVNDKDLIEISFLSYGQKVEQKVDNHVFDESPMSKISQWGLEKINYVNFLRIKCFLSNFLRKNLDVGFKIFL
jgi:hypothetical protein